MIAHGEMKRWGGRSVAGSGGLAFSLAEVVISLGIVSMAILSIIGVLSVGMQGSKESSEDTMLALASQEARGWSHRLSFPALKALVADETPLTLYFNGGGTLLVGEDEEPMAELGQEAMIACRLTVSQSPVSEHLLMIQYRFEWPLTVPVSARERRSIVGSRFDEN